MKIGIIVAMGKELNLLLNQIENMNLFLVNNNVLVSKFSQYTTVAIVPVSYTHLDVYKRQVHDIRHSHAAFLINKGVQPLMIKERFGHTDIRITLNTYGQDVYKRQGKDRAT